MSAALSDVVASDPSNVDGYRSFKLGKFELSRDAYFVTINWPAKGKMRSHQMSVEAFLRACMRDVAWNFFYGWVNFDHVIGTRNHYGRVDFYAGTFNGVMKEAGVDYVEQFDSAHIMATFKAILRDWVNEGFDPFAAPTETGSAFGAKHGENIEAIERTRIATKRMPGLPGDSPLRDDMPVNRAFADVPQDEPEVRPEPGFKGQLHAFNLFKYLSRSDVTWNPSVTSVCRASLACPTTEEYILPVFHGNDRVEWFIQLSDCIVWDVADKNTGAPRARVTMRAGDVAAMPADIRHQGYSTKRSMLYVWENTTPGLPQRYERGELPPYPVEF
ncbi:MAG TPA: hydroxyquinol 1,2-dioxygenase [Kiloniellales bacterium]